MELLGEDDVIHVPRPRSVLRMLLAVLHIRTLRRIARDRGDAITAVTEVMSASGRAGTVISRQYGTERDEWRISLGPGATPALPATKEPQHP